jgi:hypothetical protein
MDMLASQKNTKTQPNLIDRTKYIGNFAACNVLDSHQVNNIPCTSGALDPWFGKVGCIDRSKFPHPVGGPPSVSCNAVFAPRGTGCGWGLEGD